MRPDRAFSTHDLPHRTRVARWSAEAADRFVRLDFRIDNPEGFLASMQAREVGELSLTHIHSAGHERKRIHRSRRQAAEAEEAFFLVSVQLDGGCRVRQDGREALLAPGDFALYDTRRPYELLLEGDYRQAVLRVPQRTLEARLSHGAALTACAVGASALPARLLSQVLQETCRTEPDAGASRDVADAVLALLSGGLRTLRNDASGPPDLDPKPARSASAALAQVRRHVLAHLADPTLDVAAIAAALGCSRSYLHKLFRSEPLTLERWIWTERLAACARRLRDPRAADATLTGIAYELGFSDAAHFSRSFQKHYGMAPSAYRRSHTPAPRSGP